jgi:hypothetical protein
VEVNILDGDLSNGLVVVECPDGIVLGFVRDVHGDIGDHINGLEIAN